MFGLMFGLNLLIIRPGVTNNRENERVMKFKIILTRRKKTGWFLNQENLQSSRWFKFFLFSLVLSSTAIDLGFYEAEYSRAEDV